MSGAAERSRYQPDSESRGDGGGSVDPHAPLTRDVSFWGMTVTQFLGAFNDNLFKQLMLLLAIPVVTASSVGAGSASQDDWDLQGVATIVFALPFIMFSGFAGYLSDRHSKRRVVVLSKIAEVAVMVLGATAFLFFGLTGFAGLLAVLFLMGMQSAFFGPGKYGILPEMLRASDLPRANGIMLMTTFLAIIFGTASAGLLKQALAASGSGSVVDPRHLWIGSLVCVLIAVAGTCTAMMIRPVRAAKPDLKFRMESLVMTRETFRVLLDDLPLSLALLVSCVFWFVAGVAIQAVNSLGMVQQRVGEFWTSIMTAVIGLGIATGAVIAGKLSRGKADFRIVTAGAWGIVVSLVLLSLARPSGAHLLGYGGSLTVLALLGVFSGCFAIPLQVFLQDRPPSGQKGRLIAVMNQANFLAILFAGVSYTVMDYVVRTQDWPRSVIFAMIAVFVLPVAIFYRPRLEALA